MGAQLSETKAHINLLWESQFEGHVAAADRIAAAEVPVVLDIWPQLYQPTTPRTVWPDADARVRELFLYLRDRGVLGRIVALYPIDEPNSTVVSHAQMAAGAEVARRVAAEFAEVQGVPLVAIFAGKMPLIGIELYDWVGIDDYDRGYRVLGEQYLDLRSKMRPGQRTLLIPGGAWGFDRSPWPFLDHANTHPEVVGIIPFVWFDNWDNRGLPGIRSNGMAPVYCQAGAMVAGVTAQCAPP